MPCHAFVLQHQFARGKVRQNLYHEISLVQSANHAFPSDNDNCQQYRYSAPSRIRSFLGTGGCLTTMIKKNMLASPHSLPPPNAIKRRTETVVPRMRQRDYTTRQRHQLKNPHIGQKQTKKIQVAVLQFIQQGRTYAKESYQQNT